MLLAFVLIFVAAVSGVWRCPSSKSVVPDNNNGPQQPEMAGPPRPELVPVGCGKAITPPATLRYPVSGEYKNNENCQWVVTVPKGERVKAVFTAISIPHEKGSCGGDYIEISTNDGFAGKYCQDEKPTLNVTVADNVMGLTFRSDHDGTGLGFSVEFSSVMEPANVTTCGGQLLTGDSIQFPEGHCTWTVTAPEGKLVEAKFSGFGEAGIVCGKDKDYIRISPLSGATLDYCGSYVYAYGSDPLARLISSENTMKIELYVTHKLHSHSPLSANFTAIDKGSVVVQYFANFWIVRYEVTLRQPNWVLVTDDGLHNGVSMVVGAVAQLIHEVGSGPVNITIRAGTASGPIEMAKATFESDPKQSWVIRTDGVFKQDGSTDLTKVSSIRPDHPWCKENYPVSDGGCRW